MKAVILAGGRGTRLHPLTSRLPKPLVPLLGKPAIRHILDLLREHGVEEAVVTTGFRARMLEEALEDVEAPLLHFSREKTPLGTAGGVRNAVRLLAPEPGEPLLVISGDAMCDFDLTAAGEFHRTSGAAVTLLGYRVVDPREYGLICADETGRVLSFVEKPSYAGCVSDLANTGIYLLSPEALEQIPEDRPSDFARDIFPALLAQGKPLFAWEAEGYWRDIGDVGSYLACQEDMLAGRVRFRLDSRREGENWLSGDLPAGEYELRPPVCIGRNVTIGRGAVLGPGCVLGDHVRIGAGARVDRSVVGDGVFVGDRAGLEQALICPGALLEEDSTVEPLGVVGANAIVRRDAVIGAGVRVWAERMVDEGVNLRQDLRSGAARELIIGEDGFSGGVDGELTPEACLHIGMSVAGLPVEGAEGSPPAVGVGWGAKGASGALASAVTAGILAAGGNAWSFGECLESQFDFCLSKSRADYGVFIDAGYMARVRVAGPAGLPLCREQERQLEQAVNHRGYRRAVPEETGGIVRMEHLARLYPHEIIRQCSAPLGSLRLQVRSVSRRARTTLEEVLRQLSCRVEPNGEEGLAVLLAADGRTAELRCGRTVLPPERMLAAACLTELSRGKPVSLPVTAPRTIDLLGEWYEAPVLRYRESGEGDGEARALAARQPFLRDGLLMTVRVLSFLAAREMTLSELDRLLPDFRVGSRLVPLSAPGMRPGHLLGRLRAAYGGVPLGGMEGLELQSGEARALVRPLKTGKGLVILTESYQSETAAELCDRFEALVRRAAEEGQKSSLPDGFWN